MFCPCLGMGGRRVTLVLYDRQLFIRSAVRQLEKKGRKMSIFIAALLAAANLVSLGCVSNYENVERQQALENCDAEDMPSETECVEADEDNPD
jgi:hypothetical protein